MSKEFGCEYSVDVSLNDWRLSSLLNLLLSQNHLDKEHNQEYCFGGGIREGILEMKYSELKMLLKQNGCYKQSEGARHENWYSAKTGKIFQVGRHDSHDVKKGILNKILKDAGIK